jgi:hypothetical protein
MDKPKFMTVLDVGAIAYVLKFLFFIVGLG